jgi:D-beta-D-heptose 7-phosphate kinase/D-beta-D-heptose 1-phosphate adenosyltransferase
VASPSEEAEVVRINRERLREVLDGFAAVRVSIFGDLMLDRYVWGEVNRISPEAPVPVVEVTRDSVRFGGAANVAENVASLGARASVVGLVGEDAAGRELVRLLEGRGVDTGRIVIDSNRPTTTKTRIIAHSQQVVRADREDASDPGADLAAEISRRLEDAIGGSDVLVVSDYGKGVVAGTVLPGAIALARQGGKIICVDPKESHFDSYVGVTALTPNQKEAGNAIGLRIRDDATLEEVGWELSRRLETECVVITRGELGMSLFLSGGELVHLPTVAREVYDVTGAGDTVVGVLATALAAGATMVEAALIANHAAGVVIREIGTASVTPDEIERSFADVEEDEERG